MKILIWTVFLFFSPLSYAQKGAPPAATGSTTSPTYKSEGEASLSTNRIEYGVSQTNTDPATHGAAWFNWGPQLRVGLWGGNASFPNEKIHFLLQALGELKIDFSENTSAKLRFSSHNYFKSSDHNGTTIGLQLDLFGYGILWEQMSNFMATRSPATYFEFSKTWDVFQTWKWENHVGYVMVTETTLNSYFAAKSLIGTKPGQIYYQIGATYNSAAGQFGAIGQPFAVAQATITF